MIGVSYFSCRRKVSARPAGGQKSIVSGASLRSVFAGYFSRTMPIAFYRNSYKVFFFDGHLVNG